MPGAQDTAGVSNLNELSLEDLFNIKVTSASKEEETVRDSPSTVTVYTQKDIRAIGARTLNDLLAVTPGFDVRPDSQIDVRGISSTFNNRVLLLLDGVPMDDAYYGANGKTADLVYLDYVERVEIIRGPGSALYGTNAFAGVVSVTTRSGASAKGTPAADLIGGVSTDREGRGTATLGRTFGSLKLASYLDYRKAGGPTYTLAPRDLGRSGDVAESRNDFSAGIKLAYLGSAQFSINYLRRTRDGLITTDNTLMPDSGYTTDWLGSSLELQHRTEHFEVKARLSGAWDRWSNVDLMIIVPRSIRWRQTASTSTRPWRCGAAAWMSTGDTCWGPTASCWERFSRKWRFRILPRAPRPTAETGLPWASANGSC